MKKDQQLGDAWRDGAWRSVPKNLRCSMHVFLFLFLRRVIFHPSRNPKSERERERHDYYDSDMLEVETARVWQGWVWRGKATTFGGEIVEASQDLIDWWGPGS